MEVAVFLLLAGVSGAALGVGLIAARQASRPRPTLPANCGDCEFMVPRAKVYRQDTLEDPRDGLVHYLCEKRWIEITPVSPYCDLGRSKTRVMVGGKVVARRS